jgi:hypothetical protein
MTPQAVSSMKSRLALPERAFLPNVKDKVAMRIAFEGGKCTYALRTEGLFSDTEIRQILEKNL